MIQFIISYSLFFYVFVIFTQTLIHLYNFFSNFKIWKYIYSWQKKTGYKRQLKWRGRIQWNGKTEVEKKSDKGTYKEKAVFRMWLHLFNIFILKRCNHIRKIFFVCFLSVPLSDFFSSSVSSFQCILLLTRFLLSSIYFFQILKLLKKLYTCIKVWVKNHKNVEE